MGNGRKYLWIAMFIFFIGMIASMGCFIAGAMTLNVDPLGGFPILFSVGIALSVVFSILFIIVVAIVRVQSMTRLRESIAKESKKYSIRSPKPCSWRLETSSYFGYGSNDVSTYYHVCQINDFSSDNSSCCLFWFRYLLILVIRQVQPMEHFIHVKVLMDQHTLFHIKVHFLHRLQLIRIRHLESVNSVGLLDMIFQPGFAHHVDKDSTNRKLMFFFFNEHFYKKHKFKNDFSDFL